MAKRRNYLPLVAAFLVVATISARTTLSTDTAPIPEDKAQLSKWFQQNVGTLASRKSELDPALVAAESEPRVIKVRKDGSGQFKTITEAVNSIPNGNTKRVVVSIGPGAYNEKIRVPFDKPFVTFHGENMPNITFDGTAEDFGTVESATLIVESDYFMGINLNIVNSNPPPTQNDKQPQALAMRIRGNKAAFYNCRFYGYHDTLMDDNGFHFFKDCFVQGSVDFIFGRGTSLYINTELHVVGGEGYKVIAAQDRGSEAEKTGYAFVHCNVTGNGPGIFLGRAWRTHPKVIYAYTYMSEVVQPEGWSLKGAYPVRDPQLEETVFYGEYKCFGPGASQARRVKFEEEIDDKEALQFVTLGYIQGSKWLLPPPETV